MEDGTRPEASQRGAGRAGMTADTFGAPKAFRIVLIEDNAGDIYLLEKTLAHWQIPYALILYADGERAIKALERDDCIVP